MGKSRFLLKQAAVGKAGQSDLTRYIAKNSLKESREGRTARPLFTERDDDLSHWQARKFLSITGGALERADLLHYVLSFEQPEDFLRLGDDDRKRCLEVREMVRRALAKGAHSLNIKTWRWAAGIHLNRPHPHVHILINKHAISSRTHDLVRVSKLTKPAVAHYRDTTTEDEREFDYGEILNSFARDVDRIIKAREERAEKKLEKSLMRDAKNDRSERLLLAQAIMARHALERLTRAAGQSEKRKGAASPLLENVLGQARERASHLEAGASEIRDRCRAQSSPPPLPLLTRKEISTLQTAAISDRDAARIRALEKMRAALAAEHGKPTRSEREQGRLSAQLREVETDLQALDTRSERDDSRAHLIRFETAFVGPASLAGIDFRLEKERIRLSFTRAGISAWFPTVKRAAQGEIAPLLEARAQVIATLAERRELLAEKRTRTAETVLALREISDRESREGTRTLSFSGGEKTPAPVYTRRELALMEERAHEKLDAGLLREVHVALEAHESRLNPNRRSLVEQLAGRAFAREIIAGIEARETQSLLTRDEHERKFTPVAARTPSGEIVTGSLRQFEIRSRIAAFLSLLDNSPERLAKESLISHAVARRDAALASDCERAHEYFAVARELGDGYRREFERAGQTQPPPAFTAREMRLIELRLDESRNAPEREFFARLLAPVERTNHNAPLAPDRQRERGVRDNQTPVHIR